jgi:hypothetical protein
MRHHKPWLQLAAATPHCPCRFSATCPSINTSSLQPLAAALQEGTARILDARVTSCVPSGGQVHCLLLALLARVPSPPSVSPRVCRGRGRVLHVHPERAYLHVGSKGVQLQGGRLGCACTRIWE